MHDITLSLPEELIKALKKMAIDYNSNVSKVVEELINERIGGPKALPSQPAVTVSPEPQTVVANPQEETPQA